MFAATPRLDASTPRLLQREVVAADEDFEVVGSRGDQGGDVARLAHALLDGHDRRYQLLPRSDVRRFLQSAGADLAVLVKGRRDRWDDSGKTHSSLQECFGIGVVETTGTFRAQVAKLGLAS